jgi:1-phosphofructokinase
MPQPSELPTVAVFGPDPLLSVTIESRGSDTDVHIHAAGQGVWVARMVAELGARPVLCCLSGGETGTLLGPLLSQLPGDMRVTKTGGPSGAYVVDRRSGQRQLLASSNRPAPERHEVDDLVVSTCVAALASDVTVLCNPYPADGLPEEAYETIAAAVRGGGIPLIVDLSSPRLERTLPCGPDLVKLNDWELAEYVRGPVDGPRLLDGARRLREAGARAVAVTRAGEPILVLPGDDEAFEIVPPVLPRGRREGCGDSMMGAIAAAWARGLGLQEALVLGAAAGSCNFLRHGLGSGRRDTIEELAQRITVRSTPAARTRPRPSAAARTAE